MGDKMQTLEELAQIEVNAAKKREQAKQDYLDGQKKLATELPERFFILAKQVREGVHRFNNAAPVQRPVNYTESAAVTTRDPNLNGDFNLQVTRSPNFVQLALRAMSSGQAANAFIIEGSGSVGAPPLDNDRFRLRTDALYKGGQVIWRTLVDGKSVDSPIDELGDRLVMVVVTGQLTRLWNVAPWVDTGGPRTKRS